MFFYLFLCLFGWEGLCVCDCMVVFSVIVFLMFVFFVCLFVLVFLTNILIVCINSFPSLLVLMGIGVCISVHWHFLCITCVSYFFFVILNFLCVLSDTFLFPAQKTISNHFTLKHLFNLQANDSNS